MILVTSFSQRSKITTSGGLINEVRNKVEAMEKSTNNRRDVPRRTYLYHFKRGRDRIQPTIQITEMQNPNRIRILYVRNLFRSLQ